MCPRNGSADEGAGHAVCLAARMATARRWDGLDIIGRKGLTRVAHIAGLVSP